MANSHNPRGSRRGQALPPSVMKAAHDLLLAFGAGNLSALTGTPVGTLYNKVTDSPENNNKPTLAEGVVWSTLAHAQGVPDPWRIVHAFCRACGGVFVPLHGLAHTSDEALLDLILRRGKEQGDFDAALAKALEDGRICDDDFDLLHREGYEVITAFLELLSRLEGMAHD